MLLLLLSFLIIFIFRNTNLIFETHNCATATPATVSRYCLKTTRIPGQADVVVHLLETKPSKHDLRCGMLYMDGAPLTWDLLVVTWTHTLPEAINRSLREMVSSLLLIMIKMMMIMMRDNKIK